MKLKEVLSTIAMNEIVEVAISEEINMVCFVGSPRDLIWQTAAYSYRNVRNIHTYKNKIVIIVE